MNHARSQSAVKFCPTCGEKFNLVPRSICDGIKHSVRRKDRDRFCIDCGLSLAAR